MTMTIPKITLKYLRSKIKTTAAIVTSITASVEPKYSTNLSQMALPNTNIIRDFIISQIFQKNLSTEEFDFFAFREFNDSFFVACSFADATSKTFGF